MRRPEQHSLLFEGGADLPVLQYTLDDVAGLVRLVANADELRTLHRLAFRPEVLGETLRREADHAVGGRKYRLRRTIITVERNDVGRRSERVRKIENVAHGRGAERVNRLSIVADDCETPAARLERQQDGSLKTGGVLIFVDEDVIEPPADILGEPRIAHCLRPVEQEIVIIEDVLRLLCLDI